ncbi:HNH endonuclease [Bacillus wiedmannii]|nr:HNH endonuclease signature motif containing protein [Bacillus wiedmannii]
MISTQSEIRHYNHIVPLDKYGCNDPTNFQLLCKPCNGNGWRRKLI